MKTVVKLFLSFFLEKLGYTHQQVKGSQKIQKTNVPGLKETNLNYKFFHSSLKFLKQDVSNERIKKSCNG